MGGASGRGKRPVVVVRYFAGARAAAGIAGEEVPARSLDELIAVLAERRGYGLAKVLDSCSFLVDGLTCHDRLADLPEGATVDVLPPFAGG